VFSGQSEPDHHDQPGPPADPAEPDDALIGRGSLEDDIQIRLRLDHVAERGPDQVR